MKKTLSCYFVVISLSLCTFPARAQFQSGPTKKPFLFSPQQNAVIRKRAEYVQRPKTPQDLAGTWAKKPGAPIFEQRVRVVRERYAFATDKKYRRELTIENSVACGVSMVENEVGTYSIEYYPRTHSSYINFNVVSRVTTITNPCSPQGSETKKYGDSTVHKPLQLDFTDNTLTTKKLCFGAGNCFFRQR